MQKYRSLSHSPYIRQACQSLKEQCLEPSDKYIPVIISLQNIIEQVDDLFTRGSGVTAVQGSSLPDLEILRSEVSRIKRSIDFPISESRKYTKAFATNFSNGILGTALLQIHIAELLLNQSISRSSLFGLEDLRAGQPSDFNTPAFLPWLSENMMATKSIIDVYLSLPSGEEAMVSNLEWIALYCSLSLAARLELVAAQPQIQHATRQLRRLCDVSLTLRQVVLRLESASSKYRDTMDCKHALHHLGLRGRRLETWYLSHLPQEEEIGYSSASSERYTPYLDSSASTDVAALPSHARADAIDDSVISEMFLQISSDANFGNLFFAMPGLEEEAFI